MGKAIISIAFLATITVALFYIFRPSIQSDSSVVAETKQAISRQNDPEHQNGVSKKNIDRSRSTVRWSSKKIIGATEHTGMVKLKNGSFSLENGMVKSGEFVIDMQSIKNEDLPSQTMRDKLETHLKSADFFDVEQFPEASFISTSIEPMDQNSNDYQVMGNLTIKDISNSLNFPATINVENGSIIADAEFAIDRSQWNVRYGSDTFFDNLGDQAIDNIITFNVRLESE